MFLVLAVFFGAVALVQLRSNNDTMVQLRETVYEADKNNGDVEGALRELREYVHGHMNTSLTTGANAVHPPIQLKYTYEREQAKQQAQLGPGNSNLYAEAQATCEAQLPNGTAAELVGCVEQYTASRGVILSNIPDALYKFDFTSAKWSPDLAGWSLVFTILSILSFAITSLYKLLSPNR